jgi:hypothetical protein
MKKSRLAGALETRKKINEAEHGPERATTPAPPATLEAEPNSEPKRKPAAKKRSIARKRAEPPPAPPIKRGVGRPPGKRSSEDYQSVTTFIRRDTYADVMSALWEDKKRDKIRRNFGDLLEELLTRWLTGATSVTCSRSCSPGGSKGAGSSTIALSTHCLALCLSNRARMTSCHLPPTIPFDPYLSKEENTSPITAAH